MLLRYTAIDETMITIFINLILLFAASDVDTTAHRLLQKLVTLLLLMFYVFRYKNYAEKLEFRFSVDASASSGSNEKYSYVMAAEEIRNFSLIKNIQHKRRAFRNS